MVQKSFSDEGTTTHNGRIVVISKRYIQLNAGSKLWCDLAIILSGEGQELNPEKSTQDLHKSHIATVL
jgi:hypothetical protein